MSLRLYYSWLTKHCSTISASLVVAISLLAMVGWWMGHATLASLLPAIADMTFNTAFSFFLLATVCLLPVKQLTANYNVRVIIASTVGLFATFSLLQDLFSINFGIDNVLFNSTLQQTSTPHAGRMSSNTAVGFMLSSMILLLLTLRRRTHHAANTIHGLILLLGLIALAAFIMHFIIDAVPTSQIHFFSISPMTALSFLLLTITTLSIFRQRHHHAHQLLYSTINLMYALKYTRKFALISTIFLIPIALLVWNENALLNKDINLAKLKIIGIKHILENSQIIQNIAEHRGMINAQFANKALFVNAIKQKTAEIDRLFRNNTKSDQQLLPSIAIPSYWPSILTRWNLINNMADDQARQWQLHSEIIMLIGHHLDEVSRESLLSFDRNPQLHDMLNAPVETMPDLLENLGQLRGQGTALMAHRNISSDERSMITALISQIRLQMKALQRHPIAIATIHGKRDLLQKEKSFTSQVRALLIISEQMMVYRSLDNILPFGYFQQATTAIRSGFDLQYSALDQVQHLLHLRIDHRISTQYTMKLSILWMLLLISLFLTSFYQSVLNTIQALNDATKRMQQGESKKIATLASKDELGTVVQSFNSIYQELMRVASQMEAVIKHAVDGIVTIDQAGVIRLFNPAAEQIFGYRAEQVIGRNIIMLMPEAFRNKHQQGLRNYLQGTGSGVLIGAAAQIHVQGLRNDGKQFPMELAVNVMEIDEKPLFVGMIRDITEQQQLIRQLQHAQKMEAIGTLVGGVAHNFNNMLSGIVGNSYLAKTKAKQQPQLLPYLESIEQIAQQAAEMVKDLLTFAHKDCFRDQKMLSLSQLIKEGFKTAKLGISEDIVLTLKITDTSMMIHCDANQVQQVLLNMINNARDAVANCRDKMIAISLNHYHPDADFFANHSDLAMSDYACLQICDNGDGIDHDTMEQIFEPFFSTKEVGKGTGLGLSTAFGTINSHGGTIEVESRVGEGTTFRIYLPLCEEEDAQKTEPSATPDIIHSTILRTLLLVDDEPLVREPLQEVLQDLGYRVITANDGAQGLALFKEHQQEVSAVITDVMMPNMGGVEMFRNIRQLKPTTPVLFITGYDRDAVDLHDNEKEQTEIILKPVQIAMLSERLHALINSVPHG